MFHKVNTNPITPTEGSQNSSGPPNIADQQNGFSLKEGPSHKALADPTPITHSPPILLTTNQAVNGNLKIMSVNCNSIYKTKSSNFTEKDLTMEMYKQIKEHTIVILNDTHLTMELKKRLEQKIKTHYVTATEYNRRRAGTSILIKKDECQSAPETTAYETNFTHIKGRTNDGPRYNLTCVKLKRREKQTIIGAIYGTTATNKESFWIKFSTHLCRFTNTNPDSELILAGDFNVHMDNQIFNQTKAGKIIIKMMDDHKLRDVFRAINPKKPGFTHWSHRGQPSRIDYILTNIRLEKGCDTAITIPGAVLQTDHEAISVEINKGKQKKIIKPRNPKQFNDNVLKTKKKSEKRQKRRSKRN